MRWPPASSPHTALSLRFRQGQVRSVAAATLAEDPREEEVLAGLLAYSQSNTIENKMILKHFPCLPLVFAFNRKAIKLYNSKTIRI